MNGTLAALLGAVLVVLIVAVVINEHRKRNRKPKGRWATWEDEPKAPFDDIDKPDGYVDGGS